MDDFRQINIRVPEDARPVLLRIGAMLRSDPDFVDTLIGFLDTPDSAVSERVTAIEKAIGINPDDGYLSLADVNQRLKLASMEADEVDAENDHTMAYSSAARRQTLRLAAVADFIGNDMLVSESSPGRFVINDEFEIAPLTKKWRCVGKSKWYRYRDAKSFKDRFVDRVQPAASQP